MEYKNFSSFLFGSSGTAVEDSFADPSLKIHMCIKHEIRQIFPQISLEHHNDILMEIL